MKSFAAVSFAGLAAVVSAESYGAAPTGGVTPVVQSCQAKYTQCSSSGTYNAQDCSTELATCQAACKTTEAQCVSAGSGGATCAAAAATCLGVSAYPNGSNNNTSSSATAAPTEVVVTTTLVVESFTTFCPEATAITTNGNTYTVPAGGYATITDCPCTITTTLSNSPTSPASNSGSGNTGSGNTGSGNTGSGSNSGSNSGSTGSGNNTYTGPKYTGAASKAVGASLSVVAAGAALFAFAL